MKLCLGLVIFLSLLGCTSKRHGRTLSSSSASSETRPNSQLSHFKAQQFSPVEPHRLNAKYFVNRNDHVYEYTGDIPSEVEDGFHNSDLRLFENGFELARVGSEKALSKGKYYLGRARGENLLLIWPNFPKGDGSRFDFVAPGPARGVLDLRSIGIRENAYVVRQYFPTLYDTSFKIRSQLQIFENGVPLKHVLGHREIRNGSLKAAFSHIEESNRSVVYFSTADGTDPRLNGRRYTFKILGQVVELKKETDGSNFQSETCKIDEKEFPCSWLMNKTFSTDISSLEKPIFSYGRPHLDQTLKANEDLSSSRMESPIIQEMPSVVVSDHPTKGERLAKKLLEGELKKLFPGTKSKPRNASEEQIKIIIGEKKCKFAQKLLRGWSGDPEAFGVFGGIYAGLSIREICLVGNSEFAKVQAALNWLEHQFGFEWSLDSPTPTFQVTKTLYLSLPLILESPRFLRRSLNQKLKTWDSVDDLSEKEFKNVWNARSENLVFDPKSAYVVSDSLNQILEFKKKLGLKWERIDFEMKIKTVGTVKQLIAKINEIHRTKREDAMRVMIRWPLSIEDFPVRQYPQYPTTIELTLKYPEIEKLRDWLSSFEKIDLNLSGKNNELAAALRTLSQLDKIRGIRLSDKSGFEKWLLTRLSRNPFLNVSEQIAKLAVSVNDPELFLISIGVSPEKGSFLKTKHRWAIEFLRHP